MGRSNDAIAMLRSTCPYPELGEQLEAAKEAHKAAFGRLIKAIEQNKLEQTRMRDYLRQASDTLRKSWRDEAYTKLEEQVAGVNAELAKLKSETFSSAKAELAKIEAEIVRLENATLAP
jgi:hypothetical protein